MLVRVLMAAGGAVSPACCVCLPIVGLLTAIALQILPFEQLNADEAVPQDEFQGSSFSVYALSRGAGVPDAASSALERIRGVFEGMQRDNIPVRIVEERIGLEGERRLCVEFADDEAARAAWRNASTIVAGVDLVSLKVEACPR